MKHSYYKILERCRFCKSDELIVVLRLGDMPLAGGFLKKSDLSEELFFPLELQYCSNCHLVQVSCVPDPKVLFNEKYFFHSSSTKSLITHFNSYAENIFSRYLKKIKKPKVLEIGCNDGVLLKPLSQLGCDVIGVDPSESVTSKIKIKDCSVYSTFFTEDLSHEIYKSHGKVDLITANFSFAHIDDMFDVMRGIQYLLPAHGIFVFELYYLKTIIREMNYDMIYHEHMSYYSLISLKIFLSKFQMEIFEIEYFPKLRSGALRIHAKWMSNNSYSISNNFSEAIKDELVLKLNSKEPFIDFSNRIHETKQELMALLLKLKNQGKRIIGYGASGRSTILMNYCGINKSHIDCVVDDAVEKQGYLTPGNHLEILTWEEMYKQGVPDYIVLFAWSFTDEVLLRRKSFREGGGKFILPLPKVSVI